MHERDPLTNLAYACGEDWDAMSPGEGGRFCDRCAKQVTDLSAMTRAQAEAFVRLHPRACVSFLSDAEGRAIFQPRPHAIRQAPGGLGGMLAAAALSLPMLLAGCAFEEESASAAAVRPIEVQPGAPLRLAPRPTAGDGEAEIDLVAEAEREAHARRAHRESKRREAEAEAASVRERPRRKEASKAKPRRAPVRHAGVPVMRTSGFF